MNSLVFAGFREIFSSLGYFGKKRVFGFLRIFISFLFFLVWGGGNYAHEDFRHGKLENVLGTANSDGKLFAPLQILVLAMYWNMSYLD